MSLSIYEDLQYYKFVESVAKNHYDIKEKIVEMEELISYKDLKHMIGNVL